MTMMFGEETNGGRSGRIEPRLVKEEQTRREIVDTRRGESVLKVGRTQPNLRISCAGQDQQRQGDMRVRSQNGRSH